MSYYSWSPEDKRRAMTPWNATTVRVGEGYYPGQWRFTEFFPTRKVRGTWSNRQFEEGVQLAIRLIKEQVRDPQPPLYST